MHHWHGPYRIIELPSPVDVKVQAIDGKKIIGPIHVSRLKKCYSMQRPKESIELTEEEVQPVIENMRQEKEYEVSSIDDMRKRKGQTEYHVQWKGYSRDQATWEPENNLEYCEDELHKFHKKRKIQCEKCNYISSSKLGMRNHTYLNH